MVCNKRFRLTYSNIPATVDFITLLHISDPLGILRYETFVTFTRNIGSWPSGVVIARKKPALVVNVCTSPPLIGSKATA